MTILVILFSLLPPDLCKIGGLVQEDDRSLALVYADPDRDNCSISWSDGPAWTWERRTFVWGD
jgi:hypothetical protein